MGISVVSAFTNGLFWACASSPLWTRWVTADRLDAPTATKLAPFSIPITLVLGLLLHLLVKNEGSIGPWTATTLWLLGFTVAASIVAVSLQFVIDGAIDKSIRWQSVLPVALCCALLGSMYNIISNHPGSPGKPAEASRADSQAEGSVAPDDAIVELAGRKSVLSRLSEPDSARFSNVKVVQQPSGTKAVCGEVNSKNKMGGYAGYVRFISAGTPELTWMSDELADMKGAWAELCSGSATAKLHKEYETVVQVPSDASAIYRLVSLKRLQGNRAVITTQRDGPSGTSYSRRLVNCADGTSRYTGDGRTLSEMQASPSPGMKKWEAGPISREISKFACARR